MTLTPDEIVNYDLRQALRGYAVEQVDDLLDRLADQVERNERDLDELRQRLRDTEARLASALETEGALKRTLLTAQEAAERAMADAREQADELRGAAEREVGEQLARAEEEAERLVAEAREEAASLRGDARREADRELTAARDQRAAIEARIETLRQLEHRHRSTLERHLRATLAQLESPDEPAPVVEVGAEPGSSNLTVRVREAEAGPSTDHEVGSTPSSAEGDAWESTSY